MRQEDLLRTHSRFKKWTPVTTTEMYGFLAVIMNMGIINVPDIASYWSTSWTTSIPFFGQLFSRNRFEIVFWMLHVSSVPDGQTTPKRLDKVRILMDALISNFKKNMNPSPNLSVDETMVGFRGRFGAKQYIPNKPTRYGVKAFTLADSKNGYILDILLYTGGDTLDSSDPLHCHLPQPARIVLTLSNDYLDEGRTIFTDRYYTNIPLVQTLELRQTSFTGTCVSNRKEIPQNFRQKNFRLADGEVRAYRSGHLLALAWRAPSKRKGIIMLTSKESAQQASVTSRATGRTAVKPVVVDKYNQSMNGVNLADQYTVYYSFVRRSKKWWRKVCFWLLEVATVNAYILYKTSNASHTHLQFRRAVIESLARLHLQGAPERHRGRPFVRHLSDTSAIVDPERLDRKPHFLSKREQRQCVVCSTLQNRHRSAFYCKTCHSHPTLCPDICHEKYHTLVNFKQ